MTDKTILIKLVSTQGDGYYSLTGDFIRSLRSEGIGEVEVKKEPAIAGAKGDAVTAGTILLTLIGSGGVIVALVDVLKTYIARQPSLEFQFERPDGRKVRLSAQNFTAAQFEKTQQLISDVIKE
jgi:hypothetical protein